LLAEKDFEPWLSGKAGLELLKPAPNDALQRWPVSQRVNSSRAPDDDQTLIDRISKGDGEPALASPPSLF
jgi:putative SOS response-associated peptidase YedK